MVHVLLLRNLTLLSRMKRTAAAALVFAAVCLCSGTALAEQGNRQLMLYLPARESLLSSLVTYLEPPAWLRAISVEGKEIRLNWVDQSADENGFEIWRRTGTAANWEAYGIAESNATSFIDRNVEPDRQYFYMVRARQTYFNVYSGFSNEAGVWNISLKAPDGLEYAVYGDAVNIFWKDNSELETGFEVQIKRGLDSAWTTVAYLPANTTRFGITLSDKDIRYFFRVKVYDAGVRNAYTLSEEIEVSMKVPETPASIKAYKVSPTQIRVVWTGSADRAQGFRIERRMGSKGAFRLAAKIDADDAKTDTGAAAELEAGEYSREFTVNKLLPGKKYYFRICTYNQTGYSPYSSTASASTPAAAGFSDVPDTCWAYKEINQLAGRNVLAAEAGGPFYPDAPVTRGEFVYTAIRALGLKAAAVGSFGDVNPAHDFYDEIMIAQKYGIISGNTQEQFFPDNPIKREDMAVIAVRAMKAAEKTLPAYEISVLARFSDRQMISAYAQESMAALRGGGYLNGILKDGRYWLEPAKTATRAEAAVLLYNLLNK